MAPRLPAGMEIKADIKSGYEKIHFGRAEESERQWRNRSDLRSRRANLRDDVNVREL
jgi:hypothetical protein